MCGVRELRNATDPGIVSWIRKSLSSARDRSASPSPSSWASAASAARSSSATQRPIQLPKMERCNGRTMEIYRRLSIANAIRAAGLPLEAPMDVFLTTSMADPPLVHLAYPSVPERHGRDQKPQRRQPPAGAVPGHLTVHAGATSSQVRRTAANGWRSTSGVQLTSYVQDENGVTANLQSANGQQSTVRTSYLVGCDGGSSTVRKQAGIQLQGRGGIRTLRQALFHCPDLYQRLSHGKGRHYHIAEGPLFPFIILQDSTRDWTVHAAAASDDEMATIFASSLRHATPVRRTVG